MNAYEEIIQKNPNLNHDIKIIYSFFGQLLEQDTKLDEVPYYDNRLKKLHENLGIKHDKEMTESEAEIIRLVKMGMSNNRIAEIVSKSHTTVQRALTKFWQKPNALYRWVAINGDDKYYFTSSEDLARFLGIKVTRIKPLIKKKNGEWQNFKFHCLEKMLCLYDFEKGDHYYDGENWQVK